MNTATSNPSSGYPAVENLPDPDAVPEMRIYSHSSLFYWWPIWAFGFVFAALTAIYGERVTIGENEYLMHSTKYIGVIYAVVILLTVLLTNVSMRGMTSFVVILVIALVGVTLAWMNWLDDLVAYVPYLGIHMNLGFYVFMSTSVFILWCLTFFLFDRTSFWRIRPGQMTYEKMIGDAEKSYDTRGLVFEKHLEDYPKHLMLGLGMGDLHISTSGARAEEIYIPNVFLVDRKVRAIQRLIAVKPDTAVPTPQQ